MKILFYNWADCLSADGGGVTVYLRNLLGSKPMAAHELYMLSSGNSYQPFGKAFWRELPADGKLPEVRRFEVVNSKVLAPALSAFANPRDLASPWEESVILDFVKAHGPFDVLHLHNLEGLPLNALRLLKAQNPACSIIYSVHNYFPYCPQINLIQPALNICCGADISDARCANRCKRIYDNSLVWTELARRVPGAHIARRVRNLPIIRGSVNLAKRLFNRNKNSGGSAFSFEKRRKDYVDTLNETCDAIVCVSERVSEISEAFGVAKEKLVTEYIGTELANVYEDRPERHAPADGSFNLAYIGYATDHKGFFFLVNSLARLDPEIAGKISLFLSVKYLWDEPWVRASLYHFRNVTLISQGYRREDLAELLKDTHLGIVPQLWEDCLPQTALEMHCLGIPLLCSDRGGAKELGNNADFVFKAGDMPDFLAKLGNIIDGKVALESYWQNARTPRSIDAHSQNLLDLYEKLGKTPRVAMN